MSIEKEVVIKSIQEMPERFSWDELWDRLYLLKKVQIAMEQSKNEQGISIEESQKRLEKWGGKNVNGKKIPQFGSMKGLVVYMAPDFNEPLEEFKEYMEA